jgi:Uma2 family endonuclease
VSSTTQNLTAEQLFQMPDDGFRYELVKGELKKMTPAGFKHGAIVAGLTGLLTRHVKENDLGVVSGAETGFKIGSNPDTVRAPDIALVRRERIPASGLPDTFWPGGPDLAVEILSPNDTVYEVEEKVADWLLAGVRAVWIVNPKQRTVRVHRPSAEVQTQTENDTLDGREVVPLFRCKVTEIFA